MSNNRWIALSLLILTPVCGTLAQAQFQVPEPPKVPQVTPPVAPTAVENIAVTELRIGLQKAQIQSALADRVAQVKDDSLKMSQAKANGVLADQEIFLNAQADAIAARAAADAAKVEVASLEVQNRAGPAALQQAQSASMQQASPLIAQLMQMDLKRSQIQAASAAQIAAIKQKIYDLVIAEQKAGTATPDKVADAMLELEAAKAGQQTAALDEQLSNARMAAAGIRR